MKINARRLKLAGLAGIAAGAAALAVALSGTAVATPALTFVSEILSQTFFESIKVNAHADDDGTGAHKVKIVARDPSDVFVVRNTVAPGGYSGWHTHPGPSVVSVTSGTATVYSGTDPSCAGVTYPAGTGFIDEGGGHVHMVRNQGAVPLVLVAFQIVPHGIARRQDAPDPGFCPF
jgi:mannose-6-phosphate isomerase-like protein (cupin superfamily)